MTASVGTKTGAESVIQNSAKMINKHAAIIWKIRALLPHPSNPRNCVSCICRSQLPPNFWKVSQSSILLLKYLSRPLAAWLDQAALPIELWTEKQQQILPTTKECYNIRCAITVLHFLIIWHIFFQSLCWLSIEIWDIYLNKTKIIQIELLLIIIKCNVYSVVVNSKGQSALAKYEWILLKAQWAKSQVIQDLM